MKNKVLYFLIGLGLVFGLYSTRLKGIDDGTRALLDQVLAIDSQEFFPGFDLAKYPQDVNYGKIEYRYYKGQVSEQKPEYPPALSAIPTDEGPVTKVLPVKDFRNFYDLGDTSKADMEKVYLSVLIHEAFHCHQMTNGYGGQMNTIKNDPERYGDFQKSEALMVKLDDDKTFQDLWKAEMEALVDFKESGKKEKYGQALDNKMAYLKEKLEDQDYKRLVYYFNERELIEGTARFVENKFLDSIGLERNGEYEGLYIKTDSKFYTSGALKSEILEDQGKLDQVKFDMSLTLNDLLGL